MVLAEILVFCRYTPLFFCYFSLHSYIHINIHEFKIKFGTLRHLCLGYASVTFAKVVVGFICLRFLRSPYDFFWRQTRTKLYGDLADMVRQPQGYRTIIVLSSKPPYINRKMPVR